MRPTLALDDGNRLNSLAAKRLWREAAEVTRSSQRC